MLLVLPDSHKNHQKTSAFPLFSGVIEKNIVMKWVNNMTTCQLDSFFQNQPSRGVLLKRCSEDIQQLYRRTLMAKCDINKVAISNFIEITLQHGCSLVNQLHIFRTPFPNNTPGGLLMFIYNSYSCFKLIFYFNQS